MNQQDTLGALIDHVCKAMERDGIDPDVAIGDLGFDSMRVVELITICDQIYGTAIDPQALDLTQYTTLRDIDAQFRAAALQGGEQKR